MAFKEIRPQGVFKSPTAPFSLATRSEGGVLLHISGQVPQDAAGANVGLGDVRAQAEQVIQNIKAIVEAEGGSLADVCRLTIYLTAREYLPTVMEVRSKHFKDPFPAATAVVVSGLANVDWLVEIEAAAVLD
ncbi:RidA family protein [Chelatococcus sp. GCM10030263]|uniref:RidA family protein n=1 Tax=Chelatococcus sp. GCM10030263 TaxID=3273387 RepID=UPI003620E0C5